MQSLTGQNGNQTTYCVKTNYSAPPSHYARTQNPESAPSSGAFLGRASRAEILTFTLTRRVDCEVVLDKAKHGEKVEIVEIVVKVPQHTFNATAEGENLYKALADAEAKVETQLKKHHDKLVSHH